MGGGHRPLPSLFFSCEKKLTPPFFFLATKSLRFFCFSSLFRENFFNKKKEEEEEGKTKEVSPTLANTTAHKIQINDPSNAISPTEPIPTLHQTHPSPPKQVSLTHPYIPCVILIPYCYTYYLLSRGRPRTRASPRSSYLTNKSGARLAALQRGTAAPLGTHETRKTMPDAVIQHSKTAEELKQKQRKSAPFLPSLVASWAGRAPPLYTMTAERAASADC